MIDGNNRLLFVHFCQSGLLSFPRRHFLDALLLDGERGDLLLVLGHGSVVGRLRQALSG